MTQERANSCVMTVLALLTVGRRSRLESQRGAEARAVVEAPALLHLPWAAGLRVVLLARRAAYSRGARRQRRALVSDGLRRAGVVHADPISEADLAADG